MTVELVEMTRLLLSAYPHSKHYYTSMLYLLRYVNLGWPNSFAEFMPQSLERQATVHYERCDNLQQPRTLLCCVGTIWWLRRILRGMVLIFQNLARECLLTRMTSEGAYAVNLWCFKSGDMKLRFFDWFIEGLTCLSSIYSDCKGALGYLCIAARDLWCALPVLYGRIALKQVWHFLFLMRWCRQGAVGTHLGEIDRMALGYRWGSTNDPLFFTPQNPSKAGD